MKKKNQKKHGALDLASLIDVVDPTILKLGPTMEFSKNETRDPI